MLEHCLADCRLLTKYRKVFAVLISCYKDLTEHGYLKFCTSNDLEKSDAVWALQYISNNNLVITNK